MYLFSKLFVFISGNLLRTFCIYPFNLQIKEERRRVLINRWRQDHPLLQEVHQGPGMERKSIIINPCPYREETH